MIIMMMKIMIKDDHNEDKNDDGDIEGDERQSPIWFFNSKLRLKVMDLTSTDGSYSNDCIQY